MTQKVDADPEKVFDQSDEEMAVEPPQVRLFIQCRCVIALT